MKRFIYALFVTFVLSISNIAVQATTFENKTNILYSEDDVTWSKVGPYYRYDENYGKFYSQGPVWIAFIGGQMYASINAGKYNFWKVRKTCPADKGYSKFSHVFDDGSKGYFNIN